MHPDFGDGARAWVHAYPCGLTYAEIARRTKAEHEKAPPPSAPVCIVASMTNADVRGVWLNPAFEQLNIVAHCVHERVAMACD
jgi:hypothetical protein